VGSLLATKFTQTGLALSIWGIVLERFSERLSNKLKNVSAEHQESEIRINQEEQNVNDHAEVLVNNDNNLQQPPQYYYQQEHRTSL
jgi:hypothetical protein